MESWNCCLTYKQKKINPTICSSFQWFQDEEQAHKICILALVSKTKKKKKDDAKVFVNCEIVCHLMF